MLKNRRNNLNAELEMIKDLRKRIYGEAEKSKNLSSSNYNCIFCGSKSKLHKYKNLYICQLCISNFKSNF